MQRAYPNRINWENEPSEETPLNETNLNKMDYALYEVDGRVVAMDTTKLDTATGNTLVQSISFDESTGTFTITKLNGTTVTINTDIEKIAVNFDYDSANQRLVITLDDGTVKYVDLSALITQYEFTDSTTIHFTVSASGGVTASIINGSVTRTMLDPNVLSDIDLAVQSAEASAQSASDFAEEVEDVKEYVDDVKEQIDAMINGVTFSVDFTTGELMYTDDTVYVFHINTTTGNLEWEVSV